VKILGNIISEELAQNVPYCLLLPPGYESNDLRYPVLFLLHGLFGAYDNWVELTDIERVAERYQLIIVMPEGGDGWYTNSATVATDNYESFLIRELLPHIDQNFRTLNTRSARAIAGLSMGGYGAFKFALKRPDLFTFAASFSGALDPNQRTDDSPGFDWETLRPSIMKAFGPRGSETRRRNDLWSLAQSYSYTSKTDLPFFYFDCGLEDGFLQTNRRLSAAFIESDIPHEFKEIEGGHDWLYWSSRVSDLLQMASSKLSIATDEGAF
jgi:S-formylglutathione hydrolase FrmB